MKTLLLCDIQQGGSTTQYLDWGKRNLSRDNYISRFKDSIQSRAKTKPAKQALRTACLMANIYDRFDGDQYMLECLSQAIRELQE